MLADQAAGEPCPSDVTKGYAADWRVDRLREPTHRVADRIDVLSVATHVDG